MGGRRRHASGPAGRAHQVEPLDDDPRVLVVANDLLHRAHLALVLACHDHDRVASEHLPLVGLEHGLRRATGREVERRIEGLEERLKELNPKSIKFVCLLTCPEGIAALQKSHPDVPIYTAAIDRELNSHGYILPGLGDAGDRIFGTK